MKLWCSLGAWSEKKSRSSSYASVCDANSKDRLAGSSDEMSALTDDSMELFSGTVASR